MDVLAVEPVLDVTKVVIQDAREDVKTIVQMDALHVATVEERVVQVVLTAEAAMDVADVTHHATIHAGTHAPVLAEKDVTVAVRQPAMVVPPVADVTAPVTPVVIRPVTQVPIQ